MKLYPRKLYSVAEVKKERQRLLQLRNETQQGELLSVSGLFPNGFSRRKKKKDHTAGEETESSSFNLLSVVSSLLSSGDVLQVVLDLGLPLIGRGMKKIRFHFLERAAKEFFGGYIRWKALSLGFRMVRNMVRTSSRKK